MFIIYNQVLMESKNQDRRPQESYDSASFLWTMTSAFFLSAPPASAVTQNPHGSGLTERGDHLSHHHHIWWLICGSSAYGQIGRMWFKQEVQVAAQKLPNYKMGHLSLPVLRPLYTLGHIDTLFVEVPVIHMLRSALLLHCPREKALFLFFSVHFCF